MTLILNCLKIIFGIFSGNLELLKFWFMETFTIKATQETAKDLENVSKRNRLLIEKYLEQQVDKIIHRIKGENFKKVLDEIGAEAETNGLTEEILKEILANNH